MNKLLQDLGHYLRHYISLKFQYRCYTDIVSGKDVLCFKDCYGDLWMKDSRWSLFRVKKDNRKWIKH